MKDLKQFSLIISSDPADKGLDETVILWGIKKGNFYHILGHYSEGKSESMEIVGRIFDKVIKFIGREIKGNVIIDGIGLGVGPVSRLRELISEKNISNIRIVDAKFGEAALKKEYFMNKKAENYFGLRAIFMDELIKIPKVDKLRKHLIAMKWELTSSAKKKIVDPEDYSPDWADALCYFTWKDKTELAFEFI
ncbi:hypothetical protein LCGC14_1539300 [marine sediment metagenome]|uniref:Terminase large subunit gp17-like C-terminal domain-containing protein n=1 Tax=marine sediment metagenome TaxID=412755 RepID=A0A0F9ITP1_9ZZZZ